MITLKVNGNTFNIDIEPDTPLLWVVREQLGLTGSKFGCGIGQCGACTMLINGQATRTCIFPVSAAENMDITTIEGVSKTNHPVQQAWRELEVPQCGYCQSGQVLSAISLLNQNTNPTDKEINFQMINICRCGTYPRIRQAVHRAAELWTNAAELKSSGEKV